MLGKGRVGEEGGTNPGAARSSRLQEDGVHGNHGWHAAAGLRGMRERSPPFPGAPLQVRFPAALQTNICRVLLTSYGRLASPGLAL